MRTFAPFGAVRGQPSAWPTGRVATQTSSLATDARCGLVVRDANAADAGIDADVQRDRLLRFRRNVVERWAERRVDHRYDAASNGIFKILFVERAEKQDGLADAGIAQGDSFVKFDDSEAEDFGLWLQESSDIGDAHSVSVVFDHRQDGPRSDAAGNFLNVVAEVFPVNFHPGIERRVF